MSINKNAELRAAIQEAEKLSAKSNLSHADETRISVLLSKIKVLQNPAFRPEGYSPETRDFFRNVVTNPNELRATDMLAGQQSIAYTDGNQGGYAVPFEFFTEVLHGMAQFDPLLDESVVTLDQSPTFALQPIQISGWDLSAIAASRTGEGNQKNPITVPNVDGAVLNSFTYKLSLDASFELAQDAVDRLLYQIQEAYSIGFARGIGVDLVLGNGSGEPQGLLEFAANSGVTTAASGKLSLDDFTDIYFSVDRAYRNSPKCAWVMDDATYQLARQAVDNSGRPLLCIKKDQEVILGKPVLISPSMPSGSAAKSIVFGDLSHYVVRVSRMTLRASIEAPGYVEYGKVLYTGLMRADAVLFDPTGGEKPPIVYATNHS